MKTQNVGRILKIFGVLLVLAACRRGGAGSGAVIEKLEDPDQTLGKFTMDSFLGDRRQWSLQSPHGDLYDRDHLVVVKEPRVQFFNEGQAGSIVTAARGRLNTETKDLWAGGGVVMVSTEGVRLESDWVNYDKKTDLFTSTAPVTVTRGRSIVKGVGWEATSDLSEMVINDQRGEIAPEDSRGFGKK